MKILKKQKKSQLSSENGMTLMEILIVIAIIGGLAGLLVPRVLANQARANVKQTKLILQTVAEALGQYHSDCGKYPESLDGLSKSDGSCSSWGPVAYMNKVPKDAFGKELVYSVEGSEFTLKSLGKDGKEGGTGVDTDITLEDQ
jgi:general secretion pathway protein G